MVKILFWSYWRRTSNQPYCAYLYHIAANVVTDSNADDGTSGIAFAVRYVKD